MICRPKRFNWGRFSISGSPWTRVCCWMPSVRSAVWHRGRPDRALSLARKAEVLMEIQRILLVEDDEDIQKVARISLQFRAGWEVSLALDGEECLAKAAS